MFLKPHFLFLTLAVLFCGCAPKQRETCDVVETTYVHKYGMELAQADWSERGQDGQVVTTRADGVKVARTYVKGVLHGKTTYTFPHVETIHRIETYEKGTLVHEVRNNVSGMIEEELDYRPDGTALLTRWYDNGTQQSQEVYQGEYLLGGEYFDSAQKVESIVQNGKGERIERDPYGQLLARATIQDGQLTLKTRFYPQGSPREVIPYQNGKIEGEKKRFYPSGEPQAVETWVNGKQHGPTLEFLNGEMVSEVPYVQGVREGIERRFKNGNEVVEEITWRKDKRHGPAKTYVKGNVKTEWFFKGRPVTQNNYEQMRTRE